MHSSQGVKEGGSSTQRQGTGCRLPPPQAGPGVGQPAEAAAAVAEAAVVAPGWMGADRGWEAIQQQEGKGLEWAQLGAVHW